jgi:tetratricopeptide (TPR) repeat protein
MTQAFGQGSVIRIQEATGDPPELYRIAYRVHGLAPGAKSVPEPRDEHLVEIQLTSEYPRVSPKCKVLTPIFHPNIDPTTICVGDHWTAGEKLVDLVIRIGEMIAFQAYNIKSPLDGEAAMWADLNRNQLPIDKRDLRAALVPDLSLKPTDRDPPVPESLTVPFARQPAPPSVPDAGITARPLALPPRAGSPPLPADPGKAKHGGRSPAKVLVLGLCAALVLSLVAVVFWMYREIRHSHAEIQQGKEREADAWSQVRAAQGREQKANQEKEEAIRQANMRADQAMQAHMRAEQANQEMQRQRDDFKVKLARAYFVNGELYTRLGKWDEAITELNNAIALASNHPEFWNQRGVAYYRKGQYQLAVFDFDNAIRYSGGRNSIFLTNRADTYGKLNNWPGAMQDLAQAIRLKPDNGTAFLLRGSAHATLGQWAEASDDLYRATQLPKTFPDAEAAYALVRLQLKDPEGYRQACARLVQKWGEKKERAPAMLIAWTCSVGPDSRINHQPLIEVLERSSTNSSQDEYRRLRALGAAQFRAGKWQETIKTFQEAMEASKKPVACPALFLAMAHYKLKHPEDARKWLAKARSQIAEIQKTNADDLVPRKPMGKKGRGPGFKPLPPPLRPPTANQSSSKLPWQEQSAMDLLLGEVEELLGEVRRSADGISVYEQLSDQQIKELGAEHPSTLTTLHNLAVAYRLSGRTAEAVKLLEKVRDGRTKVLGPDDPETLNTLNSLGVAYQLAGREPEAIPLFEKVHAQWANRFGPDHAETRKVLYNLAYTLQSAKQFDRAITAWRQLLDVQTRKLPKDHRDRTATQATLGLCLLHAGKPAEAEPVLRECHGLRNQTEPDTWTTFNTKSMLGDSLLGQQKYAEAEPLLLIGYDGLKQREAKIPAAFKFRLAEAAERLVRLYEANGEADQAARWRQQLKALQKAGSQARP